MGFATSAALIGLGIGAAAKTTGAVLQSKAAKSGAEGQAEAATKAGQIATEASEKAASGFDEATLEANRRLEGLPPKLREALAPYLGLGESGATKLSDLISGGDLDQKFKFEPKDLTETPGYKFTLDQGMEAMKRAASAQGKSLGGGTLKSLLKYGQGVASTTYGAEFDRAMDTFRANREATSLKLSGLLSATRMGQDSASEYGRVVSASEVGQAENIRRAAQYRGDTGMDAARILAGATTDAAAARAAGKVGSANAWNAALGGIGDDVGGYLAFRDFMKPRSRSGSGTDSLAFNLPVNRRTPLDSYYDLTSVYANPERSVDGS